jgi:hypothetical protein
MFDVELVEREGNAEAILLSLGLVIRSASSMLVHDGVGISIIEEGEIVNIGYVLIIDLDQFGRGDGGSGGRIRVLEEEVGIGKSEDRDSKGRGEGGALRAIEGEPARSWCVNRTNWVRTADGVGELLAGVARWEELPKPEVPNREDPKELGRRGVVADWVTKRGLGLVLVGDIGTTGPGLMVVPLPLKECCSSCWIARTSASSSSCCWMFLMN